MTSETSGQLDSWERAVTVAINRLTSAEAIEALLAGAAISIEIATPGRRPVTIVVGQVGTGASGSSASPDYRLSGSAKRVSAVLDGEVSIEEALLSGDLVINTLAPDLARLARLFGRVEGV